MVDPSATPPLPDRDFQLEKYKAELQAWVQRIGINHRAVIDLAAVALKSITLVNGAAAIAILAFLGNIWGPDNVAAKATAVAVRPALLLFVLGTASGVLAAGLAYIAQALFSDTQLVRVPIWIRVIAVLFGLFGTGAFVVGAMLSVDAFSVPSPK